MTKYKRKKLKGDQIRRSKYSAKRRSPKWIRRKRMKREQIRNDLIYETKQPPIKHVAPKKFSFINNTNEVLKYFIEAEKLLRKRKKIFLDITKIDELSPDAIALLVANINNVDFHHNTLCSGDAPEKQELRTLFLQSGFYDFVHNRGFKKIGQSNILHRERQTKVLGDIAEKAMINGMTYSFDSDKGFDALYEILIESMSNTNNHASGNNPEKCDWWLYVYNHPNSKITSYSFFDLGTGIFDSIKKKPILKRWLDGDVTWNGKNINLVEELLSGKIQSRMSVDKSIRGKGIPEIVQNAKLDRFKKFYIISNDVKIDLKTGAAEELKYNFKGSFIYWEISPND